MKSDPVCTLDFRSSIPIALQKYHSLCDPTPTVRGVFPIQLGQCKPVSTFYICVILFTPYTPFVRQRLSLLPCIEHLDSKLGAQTRTLKSSTDKIVRVS